MTHRMSNRHVSVRRGHIRSLIFINYNKMLKSLQYYLHLYNHSQVHNKESAACAEQVSRYRPTLQRVCQAVEYRLEICTATNTGHIET